MFFVKEKFDAKICNCIMPFLNPTVGSATRVLNDVGVASGRDFF